MSNNFKIDVVDYGVGNLYSLVKIFQLLGANVTVSEDASPLSKADAIVLPGVGSFEAGMRGLETRGLVDALKKMAEQDKPILGICLGAQIMLSEGHEFGVFKGLDIVKGKVVKFPPLKEKEKVPHVGWNNICINQKISKPTILQGINKENRVYFVHSYVMEPESNNNILATSDYGEHRFCSVINKKSIYGCQFHPEKSGKVGIKIIKNFIDYARNRKN